MFNFKERRANNGDIKAILELIHENLGEKFSTSKPDYFKWSLKGSELNNSEAMYHLAKAYEFGVHTEVDSKKAFDTMLKSYETKPSAAAAHSLGIYYINGVGVKKDINKAYDYNMEAVRQNYPGSNEAANFISELLAYEHKAENNDVDGMRELMIYYTDHNNFYDSSPKVYEYAKKLVDNNDPSGLGHIYLAKCYFEGFQVDKDLKKHYELMLQSDKINPTKSSKVGLINSYFFGEGVEKDFEKAKQLIDEYRQFDEVNDVLKKYLKDIEYFQTIEQQAYQGNVSALSELINIYRPIKTEDSSDKFIDIVHTAAQENIPDSYFYLAKFYEKGVKTEVDLEKAFLNMNKSFQLKPQIGTALNLSYYYETGLGVEKGFKKALQYSQIATDLGATDNEKNLEYFKKISNLEDQALLGNEKAIESMLNLYRSTEIKDSPMKFMELAKIGAVRNHPYSLVYYGKCFQYGIHTEVNPEKAFELMERSYQINQNGFAAVNLGLFYSEGFGVKQDYLEAYQYTVKAAKQNYYVTGLEYFLKNKLRNPHDESVFEREKIEELEANLRQKYYQTPTDQRNYDEVISIMDQLIEYGSSDAMNLAGFLYSAKLENIEFNPDKALNYFREAAELHNEVAIRNLAWIHEALLVKDLDKSTSYTIAFNHMKEALEYGSDKAYATMARYYLNGIGTQKDIEQARYYLNKVKDKTIDEYIKIKDKVLEN